MTNSIVPFDFESNSIRVIQDEQGEPLFVAADVCKALGLADTYRAVGGLDEDEKGTTEIRTPGGTQKMIVVNESGLYTLIIRSNRPEAKRFRKWVTGEVLPAIRKTGKFEVTAAPLSALSPLEQLKMTVTILEQQQADIAKLGDRLSLIEAEYAAGKNDPNLMTVAAYARWKGLTLSDGELSAAGRKAKRYSDEHALPIGSAINRVHGYTVGMYHVNALEWAFAQQRLIR